MAVSEITAISNTEFLVDERDGKTAPKANKTIYRISLDGATPLGEQNPETIAGVTTTAEAEAALAAHAASSPSGIEHRLQALNPARLLELGNAWLVDGQGQPVTRAGSAAPGQRLTAQQPQVAQRLPVQRRQPPALSVTSAAHRPSTVVR